MITMPITEAMLTIWKKCLAKDPCPQSESDAEPNINKPNILNAKIPDDKQIKYEVFDNA